MYSELYVMMLCHNYGTAPMYILPEELVSFIFYTLYLQVLADA